MEKCYLQFVFFKNKKAFTQKVETFVFVAN